MDQTLILAGITTVMLTNSILPYGDVKRIYECRIDRDENRMRKGVAPFVTAPDVIHGEVEARFEEQGRVCGIVWTQVDWLEGEQTHKGDRQRIKACMDNGMAATIGKLY